MGADDTYDALMADLREHRTVDWFKFDEVVGERLAAVARSTANAVLRLHSRRNFGGDGYGWSLCVECRQSWPCATVNALSDELGDTGVLE